MGLAKLAGAVVVAAAAGATGFWYLTQPKPLAREVMAAAGPGDAAHGERIFWAGGCTSCHARPKAEADAQLQLAGGLELKTAFGTFVAPNISSDPKDGIGGWSLDDFANAMLRGLAPDGSHLYPAFPYTSYARMKPTDVADLYAFLKTVPPVTGRAPDHKLTFPFNVRRGVGLWKLVYLSDRPAVTLAADAGDAARAGQYLVEGPGHCGECHTPRDMLGGLKKSQWLAGAKAAEGNGTVPNITPGGATTAWSAHDIAYYLESGFTPDFDSVGGAMADVQKNIAKLPAADRDAIATYLKAVPSHANGYPAIAGKPSNS